MRNHLRSLIVLAALVTCECVASALGVEAADELTLQLFLVTTDGPRGPATGYLVRWACLQPS